MSRSPDPDRFAALLCVLIILPLAWAYVEYGRTPQVADMMRGVNAAVVPPELPVAVADRLRSDGIELSVDGPAFEARRRSKNEFELAGIRRAQKAAEEGMSAAAALLHVPFVGRAEQRS